MSGRLHPGTYEQRNHGASVDEAKRDLLEWGVRADAELHEQVASSFSAVKSGAKGLLPWAAAGATGIGLLLRLIGVGGGGKRTPTKGSLLGSVIRGAVSVWPIVSVMMRSGKPRV